jgi:hypothetical protein
MYASRAGSDSVLGLCREEMDHLRTSDDDSNAYKLAELTVLKKRQLGEEVGTMRKLVWVSEGYKDLASTSESRLQHVVAQGFATADGMCVPRSVRLRACCTPRGRRLLDSGAAHFLTVATRVPARRHYGPPCRSPVGADPVRAVADSFTRG